MKTLLICHEEDALNRRGLASWLASFSDLVGIVALRETRERKWRRVRREVERVGPARFLFDVLPFRLYYKVALSRADAAWEQAEIARLTRTYGPIQIGPAGTPELITATPNTPEAEAFIRARAPDVMLARCKTLLAERIFTLPKTGTFVMHPGICPEYRNAHGCFWALAEGDRERVGMTLLRIDKGVDTGPVFGHYSYPYDDARESHIVIQHRVVHENLDALRDRLLAIHQGGAVPVDVSGRRSAAWGQPWLSKYVAVKLAAHRRARP